MQTATFPPGVRMTYHQDVQTVELQVVSERMDENVLFSSSVHVRDFFSELMLQWSRLTVNQRVFWIIQDAGFTVAPDAQNTWVEQIDFIAQVTAKGVFVIGSGSSTNAVMPHAKRYATHAEALAARDSQLTKSPPQASHFHVDATRRCRNGVILSFDTKHQIAEIRVPQRPAGKRFFLETDTEIVAHIRDVEAAWLSGARGHRVFFVIDYENFDVNPVFSDLYVQLVNDFFSKSSLAIVRYNANLLQSATIRHAVTVSATPANLFKERADALAAVEALKDGRVKFLQDGSPERRSATCVCGITLIYHRNIRVMEVSAPKVSFGKQFLIDTVTDARRYLQEVTLAWTEMTGSKPVYWMVNYEHFTINPEVRPAFDKDIADLMRAAAIKLVRYNASLAQKIALRRANSQGGTALDIYSSRAEALAAIEGMS